jgi:hypothetical protein
VTGVIVNLSQNKKVDLCTDSPKDKMGLFLLTFTDLDIKLLQALNISNASHSM